MSWVWSATLSCNHEIGGSTNGTFTTPVSIGDEYTCGYGCGEQTVTKTTGRGR